MPDREKVIKELEILRDICNAKSNMTIGKGKIAWAGYANSADDAIEVLKQPEQKHGHWISYGCGFYRCSVCNDAKNMNFVPNYCSTCGAKMDEEVKQE